MAYLLISTDDFNEARRKIRDVKNKGKTIVFTSDDDELARKVLEKEAINVLLISQEGRKDRVKQRGSGFNQVLAKLAKKKNVAIGINLDEIRAVWPARSWQRPGPVDRNSLFILR